MNPEIVIRPSVAQDIKLLVLHLRPEDQKEAEALSLNPEKALFHLFLHSVLRKTVVIDGEVAAMWGVVGTPLGIEGRPYLVTGRAVESVSPLTFAREYKKEVEAMQKLFPVLEQYVDASYTGAVRLMKMAGFTLEKPIRIGKQEVLFYRCYLRTNG